jgi:Domain of unknown function (DUF6285)
MQYEPTADELLAAIADLIDDELIAALPDDLRHRGRVAANLVRILEREQRLAAAAAAREHETLATLLGRDGDVAELSAALARRARTDDDPVFQRRAWEALVTIARDDLAIAKPGHDAWEGRITGLGQATIGHGARHGSSSPAPAPARARRPWSARSSSDVSARSTRSVPAQKAPPAPVTTTARTASSEPAVRMASSNSARIANVIALRFSGRSIVTVATRSRTS